MLIQKGVANCANEQSEKNRNPSKWRSNDNPRKYSVSCKLAKIIPTTGRKTGVAMTRKLYGWVSSGSPTRERPHSTTPCAGICRTKIPIESCRSPLYGLFSSSSQTAELQARWSKWNWDRMEGPGKEEPICSVAYHWYARDDKFPEKSNSKAPKIKQDQGI